MQKRWLLQTGTTLALTALLFGCAGLGKAPTDGRETGEPRLLLDLQAGTGYDQPGHTPRRVGGVSPSGPLAVAVEGQTIYLADQAKGRILQYDGEQLARVIPVPWMEDGGIDLDVTAGGLLVSNPYHRYELDRDGRILTVETHASVEEAPYKKAEITLGTDRWGNRYVRSQTEHGTVERVDSGGKRLAAATLREVNIADYFVSADGGVYALAWDWPELASGVRVYELLPPLEEPSGAETEPADAEPVEPEAPQFLGYRLPEDVVVTAPDWAPVRIAGDVERWNLWKLLAAARPAPDDFPAEEPGLGRIEATLHTGEELAIDLHWSYVAVEGEKYLPPSTEALHAVIGAVRLSPAGLQEALAAAGRVWVAIRDLPGVERDLSAEEIAEVAARFDEAYPVNRYTPPQPLEEPFPLYGLSLSGEGWEAHLDLLGRHHAEARGAAFGSPAAYSGDLAAQVEQWLPVPELPAGSLEALYLAERVEMGDGVDVTHWKNTIVRHLLGVEVRRGEVVSQEPLVVTFYVGGEPQVVEIDLEGFTYAGQRYDRPGLTDLAHLQGVP